MPNRVMFVALVVALAARAAAQTPERYTIAGDDVAVYNLVGQLKVEGGTGAAVLVEITRHGADAARLKIATGEIRDRQTLRVIYDADEVTYPLMGRGSNTTEHVRDDGTFDDGHDRRFFSRGHEVRISGSGGGLEAYADLRVVVPVGRRVAVYLAVGKATVTNVDGDLKVSVSSADVEANHTRGRLLLDTGSGNVTVTDVAGEISLDTGSGDVTVTGVTGTGLKLDTGSGDVTCARVAVDGLKVDTGSGNVELTGVKAKDVSLDTGSGDDHDPRRLRGAAGHRDGERRDRVHGPHDPGAAARRGSHRRPDRGRAGAREDRDGVWWGADAQSGSLILRLSVIGSRSAVGVTRVLSAGGPTAFA